MSEAKDPRDYIWIIPLVSAILAIIAVVTPTATFSAAGVSWDWWMWGLMTMGVSGSGSESIFVSEADFVIPSFLITLIIVLTIVIQLSLAARVKTRKLDVRYFKPLSILGALLLIVFTIYYIAAVDIAFYDGMIIEGVPFPSGYNFWDVFDPSFGVIGPFLSAVSSIIGAGVFHYYSRRREVIFPSKMETFEKGEPMIEAPGKLNFCPECGEKIEQTDADSCSSCGFKFQESIPAL